MTEPSNEMSSHSSAEVPWSGLPEGVIAIGAGCLLVVGLGVFFLYDAFHGAAMGLGAGFMVRPLLEGLAVLGLAAYLFFVRSGVPGMLGALQRIRERPGDVVWVFEKVTTSNGGTRRSLSVGFLDAKIVAWALATPLVEQPRIRSWIEHHLAHATIGYNQDLWLRFLASPRDLLRSQPPTELR